MSPDELLRRAQAGDGDAAVQLSHLMDRQRRYRDALDLLAGAARAGHVTAMTLLGARLAAARAAPHDPVSGAQLIEGAAARGGPEAAAYASVLAAIGIGRAQSWADALAYLKQAAERGHKRSQAVSALLGEVDIEAWLSPPPMEARSQEPLVAVIPGFLEPAICDWIMSESRDYLRPAQVYDPAAGGGQADDTRTNSGTGFSLIDLDVAFALVQVRIAAAAGVRREQLETTNVLHYSVGQRFSPHFDFVDPALSPTLAQEVAQKGQRTGTFLVYLNDGFEGGETEFSELGLKIRGAKGDALFFRNVDAAGRPDPRTLHAGLPPSSGEKWVLSQWMRDRPQLLI